MTQLKKGYILNNFNVYTVRVIIANCSNPILISSADVIKHTDYTVYGYMYLRTVFSRRLSLLTKIVDRTRYDTRYMFLCVKSCSSASSGHAYQVNVSG